ncbi:MAG: hypothetical protein AAF236_02270 [Verrucomicrobiota bacterium]
MNRRLNRPFAAVLTRTNQEPDRETAGRLREQLATVNKKCEAASARLAALTERVTEALRQLSRLQARYEEIQRDFDRYKAANPSGGTSTTTPDQNKFDPEKCKADILAGDPPDHFELSRKTTVATAHEMAKWVGVTPEPDRKNETYITWRVFVQLLGIEEAANRAVTRWRARNYSAAQMARETSGRGMWEIADYLGVAHPTSKAEGRNATRVLAWIRSQ